MKFQRFAIALASLFISISFAVFIAQPRQSESAELPAPMPDVFEQQRIKTILDWEPLPVISLRFGAAPLVKQLRTFVQDGCQPIPGDARPAPASEVGNQRITDLLQTLASLFQAYGKSDPTALLDYMAERGEVPQSSLIKTVRSLLVAEGGMSEDEVAAMGDNQVLCAQWRIAECATHWDALVEKAGCITFWRSDKLDNPASLGAFMRPVFKNEIAFHHVFEPKTSIIAALDLKKSVLFADIQVVIKLDEAERGERTAYYFRYWYCESDNKWHPHLMKQAVAGDATPRFLF